MDDPLSAEFFLSNHLEQLFIRLKTQLFENTHPFTRRFLIVTCPKIRTWLHLRLAKDPQSKISAGLEVYSLMEGIRKLYQICHVNHKHLQIPGKVELALKLELKILELISSWELLTEEKKEIFRPLFHYLKLDMKKPLGILTFNRLEKLADHLAFLFLEYGHYAPIMLKTWEEAAISSHWQEALWKEVFDTKEGYSYAYREIAAFQFDTNMEYNIQLHLFGFNYISALYTRFFFNLSQKIKTCWYIASPCQMFWTDSKTAYERTTAKKFLLQKGAPANQVEELEEYLKQDNFLLSNFGKQGREWLKLIEDMPYIFENYRGYAAASNNEAYQSLMDTDIELIPQVQPLTLLEAVQTDILLMRNVETTPAVSVTEKNPSIQIHVTQSKKREVEILYYQLVTIIENSQDQEEKIEPCDIKIYAPDIEDYLPHIRAIFGNENSFFDYDLYDVGLLNYSVLIQGFFHLLNLANSRLLVNDLFMLFENPAFMLKHHLTQEELSIWRNWIEELGIYWGGNSEYRKAFFHKHYGEVSLQEGQDKGSWEAGFSRLLLSLAMSKEEGDLSLEDLFYELPLKKIEFSDAPIIEKLIRLFRLLCIDFKRLSEQKTYSLEEWADYLLELLERYFLVEAADKEGQNDLRMLIEKMTLFKSFSFHKMKLPFSSIEKRLLTLLSSETVHLKEGSLQRISFASLKSMEVLPAKVVYLLGMDEEVFPKKSKRHALDCMQGEGVDYHPSITDSDRYLFLELLLSARAYFIISHQKMDVTHQKQQSASLCVVELLDYLEKNYIVNDMSAMEQSIQEHPFLPFHYKYFDSKNKNLWMSSDRYFQLAKRYYHQTKEKTLGFMPIIFDSKVDWKKDSYVGEQVISVNDLQGLASNSIKFFFNKRLEMYLNNQESKNVNEPFILSNIDRAHIQKQALKKGLELARNTAILKGHFPIGLFQDLAFHNLEFQQQELQTGLESFDLSALNLTTVEMFGVVDQCIQKKEDHYLYPPLKIVLDEDITVTLLGKIPNMTPQGLVTVTNGSLEDIVKAWPLFLLGAYLFEIHGKPFQKQILCLKKSKVWDFSTIDILSDLKKYLSYYFLALQNPSPLLPEWVKLIYLGDLKKLEGEIRNIHHKQHFYNDYAKWVFHNKSHIQDESYLKQWGEEARLLFASLDTHFATKKR